MTEAYDSIHYRGSTYPETHPDRLGTVAALYGLDAAPPSACRVLELGCGHGANLIPMAYQYPDSQFLGIDITAAGIELGMQAVAALGLTNIELRTADIMQFAAPCGSFDYIIAHGVYSWVPEPVREKVLASFADLLAPNGVAYVSYNAHPVSHLRDLSREIMHFHVRRIADPRERIAQAREILKFCADVSDGKSIHGAVLRSQLQRIDALSDVVLFHDDLDEGSEAFLLHEVVGAAERHGLQYLSDANLTRRGLRGLSRRAREMLAQFPDEQFMERDQYQDFIEGHMFRRTLLCHRDRTLERRLAPTVVAGFHLASSAVPVVDPDLVGTGVTAFGNAEGVTMAFAHPLTTQALACLAECWPAALSFSELLAAARRRIGSAAKPMRRISRPWRPIFTAGCGAGWSSCIAIRRL